MNNLQHSGRTLVRDEDTARHEARARQPVATSRTAAVNKPVPITILGAGPFGLSIAAYLSRLGAEFRVIGSPMRTWLTQMPKGMLLKSTGFSSTLYDPDQAFTIRRYCQERGILFEDVGLPVRVETFSSYGLAFQKHLVPAVEDVTVKALARCREGFVLELADGGSFKSRNVILAIGLEYFQHIPEELAHMPRELVSHSGHHHDLGKFRDRDIAVIGGGSSAIDLAALLHEAGARPQLIVRKPAIEFGLDEQLHRPILSRLRRPMSGIGPGWKNRACTDLPWLFRYLPDDLRLRIFREFLGPSAGWFMKDRLASVPCRLGLELGEAKILNGRVQLRLVSNDGSEQHLSVDHVIAATGYRTDVRRLRFLSSEILAQLKLVGQAPRLSAYFESSVPGLYFVGPISGTTFGPVMRFTIGAGFTSRRLARHLTRTSAEA